MLIAGVVGLLLTLLGPMFHFLKIEDRGETLSIQFGPISLFQRKLNYADIQEAKVGRTLLLDGLGIHFSIRGGWVWNLWGRDCVVVTLKGSGSLRIGTDDGERLAEFLNGKAEI